MTRNPSKKLRVWYLKNARDLPWRRTDDPYALWLSEIMLQQTQVVTVIPYYEKFLKVFPSVGDLAKAPLDKVLKNWEGLGYYTRARNLHKAAIVLSQEGWPEKALDWQKIPGVGASTAAALSSFITGESAPVVDGNVQRVLSRFYLLEIPLPALSKDLKTIQSLALALMKGVPAGDHNQAMMELGATICLPKNPKCEECPWALECKARQLGMQANYPQMKPKKFRPKVEVAVGLLFDKGKLLVTKRAEEGLLGGLSELPGGKIEPGERPEAAVVREFWEETQLIVEVVDAIAPIKHHYTHFSVNLHGFVLKKRSGKLGKEAKQREAKWVTEKELKPLAFPTATYKIFEKADLEKLFSKSQNTTQ